MDKNEEWMNEVLGRLGAGSKAQQEDDDIITITEDDVESGEMFLKQQRYEEELNRYPPTHPRNLFPHNFLRTQYLPVVTVRDKRTGDSDPEDVAEELRHMAYDVNDKGKRDLNHAKFCMIWHNRFQYEYAGSIFTPRGAIDEATFKNELVTMLFNIGESKNIDATMLHLYNTYIYAYKTQSYADPNKIPFRNGDLVLNPGKKDFTFYEGCLSPVPYRFDYDFKNIPNTFEPEFPNFRKWLDGLFDEEDQYTLKQMLGYLLIPSNDAQEAFFIVGKGGSGKSILTDCIIPKMLGEASFPIRIGTFFGKQFQVGTSVGKLCMVDDDIGESNLSKADSGNFKNFVTAKTIQIEMKYCNPTKSNNSARIVCSGNHMINSDDKTDGFTRRLHAIYAKPRTIEEVDRNFPKKIEKEIDMIVLWALEGLLEMLGNDGAPYKSERTRTGLEYYAESQKWEEQFINDCFCYTENTVTYSSDVKEALETWMKENMEMCGEGPLATKFKAVTKWLQDEGADKNGYIYKRGIKRGDKYNARGYINMALRNPGLVPKMWTDEKGETKIRIQRKKQDKLEKE